MKHIYIAGKKDVTLVMLHGTGGNEHDLIDIAKIIDKDANILSIRGNVLEYGMPRFFKRFAMGIFDIENLIEETHKLHDFIVEMSIRYGFSMEHTVGVGYSNGANILLSVLLHYNNPIKLAILYHPMIPIKDLNINDLSQTHVYITSSLNDQMIPKNDTVEMEAMLKSRNANTKIYWTETGHQLTKNEILESKEFYYNWLENSLYKK